MTIPEGIEHIEVYYDGHCGMCCTFHEWVNKQSRAYQVSFIPYQAELAEQTFSGVGEMDPDKEMIVRTNQGDVFKGAEAWVVCLNSCKSFQGVARRLAGPILLPMARKSCNLLAANRHRLSKLLFRKKDKEVAEKLHAMPEQQCKDGRCGYDD